MKITNKIISTLLVCCCIIIIISLTSCHRNSAQQKNEMILLKYYTWTDALTLDGEYAHLVQHTYTYANPTSSIPSDVNSRETDGYISPKQLRKLRQALEKYHFFDLKPSYGVPEDSTHLRFYPYSLWVKTNNKEHKVTFRSNPSYNRAPDDFKALMQYIEKLSHNLKPTHQH